MNTTIQMYMLWYEGTELLFPHQDANRVQLHFTSNILVSIYVYVVKNKKTYKLSNNVGNFFQKLKSYFRV